MAPTISLAGAERFEYRFSNGYGASVIDDFGTFEVALLDKTGPRFNTRITPDGEPISSDSITEVNTILKKISQLGEKELG
jgi:hypothetical protein